MWVSLASLTKSFANKAVFEEVNGKEKWFPIKICIGIIYSHYCNKQQHCHDTKPKCLLLLKNLQALYQLFYLGYIIIINNFPLYRLFHRTMRKEGTFQHKNIKAISSAALLSSKFYLKVVTLYFLSISNFTFLSLSVNVYCCN